MQSDIAHIKTEMERRIYQFEIVELGGPMPKPDRIRRLIPLFEQGRILLPESCWRKNAEGRNEDLVAVFVNHEYKPFPVGHHEDMLDCLSRLFDIPTRRPERRQRQPGPSRSRTALRRIFRRGEP